MDVIKEMLGELLPDASLAYRMNVLWECTCFPLGGKTDKALEKYREQVEECIKARPDDPIGYAHEEMDRQKAEFNENQVKEEQKDSD